jgi:hypothetical protein
MRLRSVALLKDAEPLVDSVNESTQWWPPRLLHGADSDFWFSGFAGPCTLAGRVVIARLSLHCCREGTLRV